MSSPSEKWLLPPRPLREPAVPDVRVAEEFMSFELEEVERFVNEPLSSPPQPETDFVGSTWVTSGFVSSTARRRRPGFWLRCE